MILNNEVVVCKLLDHITRYPINHMDDLDKYLHVKTLLLQINEYYFSNAFGTKELTWEYIIDEVGIYLENLEIYEGLSYDKEENLENPKKELVLNVMYQLLAIHYLATDLIEEALGTFETWEKDLIMDLINPFKNALSEAIAKEFISKNTDQTKTKGMSMEGGLMNRSTLGGSLSSVHGKQFKNLYEGLVKEHKNDMGKVGFLEGVLHEKEFEIQKVIEHNEELETQLKKIKLDLEAHKFDLKSAKNKLFEMEAALDQEKFEKDKVLYDKNILNQNILKAREELSIFASKEAEYTELITMKVKFDQYFAERQSFINSKNEAEREIAKMVDEYNKVQAIDKELKTLCGDLQKSNVQKEKDVSRLTDENIMLENENQDLRIQIMTYTKHFENQNLKKRMPSSIINEKPVSRQSSHKKVIDETQIYKEQISKMAAENKMLKSEMINLKKDFEEEMREAIENQNSLVSVQKKKLELDAMLKMKKMKRDIPKFLQGYLAINYVPTGKPNKNKRIYGAEDDFVDCGMQVDVDLREAFEIDSNYIIYSSVMGFMQEHMKNFREDILKRPNHKQDLSMMFGVGKKLI